MGTRQRPPCSVENCPGDGSRRRGWCQKHYLRWKIHGDPLYEAPDPVDLFWSRVDKTDSCWLYTFSIRPDGYGSFSDSRIGFGTVLAHRISYLLLVGEVPDDLVLDHQCHVRHCVNPDHLQVTTRSLNSRRNIHTFKTACPYGHAFSELNTYVHPVTGHRSCRTCRREAMRERRKHAPR